MKYGGDQHDKQSCCECNWGGGGVATIAYGEGIISAETTFVNKKRRADGNAGLYSAGSEKHYRSRFWASKGELFCRRRIYFCLRQ